MRKIDLSGIQDAVDSVIKSMKEIPYYRDPKLKEEIKEIENYAAGIERKVNELILRVKSNPNLGAYFEYRPRER